MACTDLFIKPHLSAFSPDLAKPYWGRYLTYSHYNFLRGGWIARMNCGRLRAAIELAAPCLGRTGALDMGCADGILLPSLSRLFPNVAGVDSYEPAARIAQSVVANLSLKNTQVICNDHLSLDELRQRLSPQRYGVMFLLETLEHVGRSPATMYDDKIAFVEQMFSLLQPGGMIVASVPKMVGPAVLAKYVIQTITRAPRQTVPWWPLIRSGLLYDSTPLEPMWDHGHVGFNQIKLARRLRERFNIVRERSLSGTMLWLLSKRDDPDGTNAAAVTVASSSSDEQGKDEA